MDTEENRMSKLQGRLSMLRNDLETRRMNKYDQLTQRVNELQASVEHAKSTNDGQFQQINERLEALSKDIDSEAKKLEQVFETKTTELETARTFLTDQVRTLEAERNETSKDLVKQIEDKFAQLREELNVETLRRQDEAHARQDIFD